MSKAIKSDRRIGPDGRPYVQLSPKLLRAAFDWCERNKGEPVSIAYMQSLVTLTEIIEFREIEFRKGDSFVDIGVPYEFFDDEVAQGMFMTRDYMARQILKRAKQEAAKP